MTDPRTLIFSAIADTVVTAAIIADEHGIITNTDAAAATAVELGVTVAHCLSDGEAVDPGQEVLRITGSPLQIAMAEERLIGLLAKPSGIATATRRFVDHAGSRPRVVSGAWKKLPFSQKEMIRSAIVAGGAAPRIAQWPFAYLDKNFVAMLGGVGAALGAVAAQPALRGYRSIIQVHGSDVVDQACAAAQGGADIVFIDTGQITDISAVSAGLRERGLRERVQLAFGGGVSLEQIARLRELDVDIVDIGRPIVDAPLLDMHVQVVAMSEEPADWSLLEKTELRIEQIGLDGANLTDIAATVADQLAIPRKHVVVIDARDDLIALDVLRQTIDARQLAGRAESLLSALGQLPGVHVDERTSLRSEGMLGWITGDREQALAALDRSRDMAAQIEQAIASRAIVFSTGPEVITGQIEDTNKPWIVGRLRDAGFTVVAGANLPDDIDQIGAALREAAYELGYGLIVTTGGVGAEGKDGTVEALLEVDRSAATPYLFRVEQGHGRHAKPGVRIGVGTVGGALVVCLPGPHAEATAGTDTLIAAMQSGSDKHRIATDIAQRLRARLREPV